MRAFPVVYASDVERETPFEMYVYVDDLGATVQRLADTGVSILRQAEDLPWGERIASVADPEGNPVAICHAG